MPMLMPRALLWGGTPPRWDGGPLFGVVVLGEPPVEGAEPLTGLPEELAEAFRISRLNCGPRPLPGLKRWRRCWNCSIAARRHWAGRADSVVPAVQVLQVIGNG